MKGKGSKELKDIEYAEYVDCPLDELTKDAIRLRDKLMKQRIAELEKQLARLTRELGPLGYGPLREPEGAQYHHAGGVCRAFTRGRR